VFGLHSRRNSQNARSVECHRPGRSRAVVCECCPEVPAFDLSLKEKAPDLCNAIASRHLQQREAAALQRRQFLEEEVWRIAKDLKAKGQNPTQSRIVPLLPDGSLKNGHLCSVQSRELDGSSIYIERNGR